MTEDLYNSMGNFWKLFKVENPRGSIKDYEAWFANLISYQNKLIACPFCKKMPELMVIEVFELAGPRLFYYTKCGNGECLIQPHAQYGCETPEEAAKTWNDPLTSEPQQTRCPNCSNPLDGR